MIAGLLVMAAAASGPAAGASVVVQVANVRNAHGHVIVALCPKDKFLATSCPYEASAPARPGVTTVVIEHVPPGEWGAQAFHDENNNREIDRGLFGIPKEGVGFSRDARIVIGPPKWRDAVFTHGTEKQTIGFKLRYFTGPGSPEAWAEQNAGK